MPPLSNRIAVCEGRLDIEHTKANAFVPYQERRSTMMEENVINGICCDVENCVYSNGSCCCTAHEIHVNHRANNGTETMCETFSEV